MYTVEKTETRAGRESVVVMDRGRRVCSASVAYVKWLYEYVPDKQLREEQLALVNWYGKQAVNPLPHS